ncbi:hypothetical protein ACWC5I_32620, partial [Kitasatospora sp. NPDC001574]
MTAQHRGQHRDPAGAALKALVLTGRLVVLGLLGVSANHQLDPAPPRDAAATVPDAEPGTPDLLVHLPYGMRDAGGYVRELTA